MAMAMIGMHPQMQVERVISGHHVYPQLATLSTRTAQFRAHKKPAPGYGAGIEQTVGDLVPVVMVMIQIVDSVEQSLGLLHEFVGLATIDPPAVELRAVQELDHPCGKRVALAGKVGESILKAGISRVVCVIAGQRLG